MALDLFRYGMANADPTALANLNCPLNRKGGNRATRYNWKLNATNTGAVSTLKVLEMIVQQPENNTVIANSEASGAQAMVTVPMINWIAELEPRRSKFTSFSIAKYGEQQDNDTESMSDTGNGVYLDGEYVTGNNSHDANVRNSLIFQLGCMKHLVKKVGHSRDNGGVRYYILDNEPSNWFDTHRGVSTRGTKTYTVKK